MKPPATNVIALLVLLACVPLTSCKRDQPPNVLLIMVDTLRADHLGSYGYEYPTSPAIDALADEGTLYEQHIASASQTVPSTLTVMLSQNPAEHGFKHKGLGHFARNRPHYPGDLVFLAEALSEAGFATSAYVANPFLTNENGFAQGFDRFSYSDDRGEVLTDAAQQWLAEDWDRSRPFFVYMHYFDVHWRYDPLPEYRARFEAPEAGRVMYSTGTPYEPLSPDDLAATIAAYDGEVAYIDDQIRRLVDEVRRLGVEEDTVIVITSDHGDEFLDHGGLGHGTTVYGELTRVPLIIVYPSKFTPGKRIADLTRHLDLGPTLLSLTSVAHPPTFRGRALQKASRTFAEDGPWVAVHDGDHKLVTNEETGLVQLFAAEDWRDQQPLDPAGGPPDALLRHLDWYRSLTPTAAPAPAGEDWVDTQREQLKALGYAE